MRILLVSDYYPPYIGGVQRQIQLLGRELRSRGHSVGVATIWSRGAPQVEDDGGVEVHRLRQLRTFAPWLARHGKRHPPPFPDPVTVLELRRLIGRQRPSVIHSYGWLSYSCAAALVGLDVPMVISARDYGYACATRTMLFEDRPCAGPGLRKCLACSGRYYGRPKGWTAALTVRGFRPLLAGRVDGIHSVSTYVRDLVRRDFLDERARSAARGGDGPMPHLVLPSFRESDPPDLEHEAIASYLAKLPSEPFVLFVGALRAPKGIQPLLDAYRRLSDPPPLVLIGTVERDTPSELPPGVVMLEDFPHQAVMAAWDRCLFGVVPSLWPEPLGSVVYEGMSRGKAVIGTVPGGHADMIEDGVSGRLVSAGDVSALAGAMRELIDNPAARERLGRAARSESLRFTSAVVVPQLEALYAEVIRTAGRA
jgi:glycosyltransferase involved in cell wall biosynthesis